MGPAMVVPDAWASCSEVMRVGDARARACLAQFALPTLKGFAHGRISLVRATACSSAVEHRTLDPEAAGAAPATSANKRGH